MTPDEAKAKLRSLLDEQAEHFRRQPQVRFTDCGKVKGEHVRILAVTANGEIEALDFLIRKANGHDKRTGRGSYTPERGWRLDGAGQATEASVYDLLLVLGVDYVKTIDIREVY